MLTQLEKSIILTIKDQLLKLRHFKKIKKLLKSYNILEIHPKELYDLLFTSPLKDCQNSKFVGFSVGYSACSKQCPCYLKNLSDKISNIKSSYSEDKKANIRQRLQLTNQSRYGVDNVFRLTSVKEKSRNTKKEKYNNENYRNNEQIIKTNLKNNFNAFLNNVQNYRPIDIYLSFIAYASKEADLAKIKCGDDYESARKKTLEKYFNNDVTLADLYSSIYPIISQYLKNSL